ncbi:hypothetical protein [Roseibium sp.]|uniref:hypothetical protein n=1 Tax=Roseibium sp. TaxID=1936156 RepID=UPI003A984A0B
MPGRCLRHHQPSATSVPGQLIALAFGVFAALTALSIQPALASPTEALQQRGFELSKLHCARCHIISEKDRFAGTSSTPSFKIMIEFLKDWEDRFDTFMARNPHPAHVRLQGDGPRPDNLPATIQEVILTLDDIEAILAYVDQMARELGKQPSD